MSINNNRPDTNVYKAPYLGGSHRFNGSLFVAILVIIVIIIIFCQLVQSRKF